MSNVYVDFDSTVLGSSVRTQWKGDIGSNFTLSIQRQSPVWCDYESCEPAALSLTRVTFYTDTLNIYTQCDRDKTFVFVSTRVLKPPTLNCLMMSGDAKPGRGRSWSDKQWLGQLIALLPSLTINVLRFYLTWLRWRLCPMYCWPIRGLPWPLC